MARLRIAVMAALLAAVSAQIVFEPGSSGQQLVQDCGKTQPSIIHFPSQSQSVSQRQRHAQGGAPSALRKKAGGQTTLVAGGETATVGKWPWMVLLGEQQGGRRLWTCGATLISARTVLTAAHCVQGRQPSALTARLGEHDIATTLDGQHVDMTVSRIIIHPNYRRPQNDIALLQLSRPVTFNGRVRPACLPPVDSEHTGRMADLAGWGLTEFNGQGSLVLQQAQLQVVDENECEQAYRPLPFYQMNFPDGFQGTKLCANGADGTSKDSCEGDSGGPLVYRTTGTDRRYQVIGVVSTGLGCGIPEFPGIYTKVSKYIPWIINNSV